MSEVDYDGLTGLPTATQRDATALLVPLMIGYQLQLLLFGLCLSMFYDYHRSEIYARHTKRMKAALWAIMGLLCLCSLLAAEELCYFGVWQRRTGAEILSAHWPSMVQSILTELVCASVQTLLTFRAANFFPRTWIRSAFITFNLFLVLVSLFGAGVSCAVGFMYLTNSAERALPFTYSNASVIWLVATAACDCSISLGLYINVRRRIADAGVAGWAFRSVVRTALQTAAYTSVFAVGGAIASIVSIVNNQSYETIDIQFVWWLGLPSLAVLSLLTTVSSNTSISKRLAQKHAETGTFQQPGRLAASYAMNPVVVQPPPSPRNVGLAARSSAEAKPGLGTFAEKTN